MLMNSQTKKLIQTEFLAFAMKAFATLSKGRSLGNNKYLKLLAQELTRVAAGETKRLVVNMPPRHCKTFMGSICLPAWILAHNPSAKIVILTYGQDLADKTAYAVRDILRSEWYQQVFHTRVKGDRAKLMDFVTTDGGGVRSLSIEGGVTGLGADFIIIDDPVEIKDCGNTKRLERVNDLFDDEIQTRLDHPKKGCIVIIAHRISEDDLPGHVLQKGGWQQLKLPLIANAPARTILTAAKFGIARRVSCCALTRSRNATFNDCVIRSNRALRLFSSRTRVAATACASRRSISPAFRWRSCKMREVPVVLSVDPGQKGGPTNSSTVIQAWAPKDGAHLLLDQWREQATYGESRSAVCRFIRKYRPSVVLIEATGQGPSLLSEIKPQIGMEFVPITPAGEKIERLRKHRRTIRRGLVQLPQGAPWYDEFISEAAQFPYGPFNDQIDAMSQYLNWIAEHPNPGKRPPLALIQSVDLQGRPIRPSANEANTRADGIAVQFRSRRMFNAPFQQPEAWVKF
jgi:predicted phage terminase large subunit-like protein